MTNINILCPQGHCTTGYHVTKAYAPRGLRILSRSGDRVSVPVCDYYRALKEGSRPISAGTVAFVLNHSLRREQIRGVWAKTHTARKPGQQARQVVRLYDARPEGADPLPQCYSQLPLTRIQQEREREADELVLHPFAIAPGVEVAGEGLLCIHCDQLASHPLHLTRNVSQREHERLEALAEETGLHPDDLLTDEDPSTLDSGRVERYADIGSIPDAKPRPVTRWVRDDSGQWVEVTHIVNVHIPTRPPQQPIHVPLWEAWPEMDAAYRPFQRELPKPEPVSEPRPARMKRIRRRVLDLDGNVIAERVVVEPEWQRRDLIPLAEPDPRALERERARLRNSLPRAAHLVNGKVTDYAAPEGGETD